MFAKCIPFCEVFSMPAARERSPFQPVHRITKADGGVDLNAQRSVPHTFFSLFENCARDFWQHFS
jgi:hypothetical protein